MFSFFCLFFPSFLSLSVYYELRKEKRDTPSAFQQLISYGVFCTVNNTAALTLFSKVFNVSPTSVNGTLNSAFLSQKYLLTVIVISIVSAVIARIARDYLLFRATIIVKEKKEKEHEKK